MQSEPLAQNRVSSVYVRDLRPLNRPTAECLAGTVAGMRARGRSD
jgi:hypothetical protein